MKIKRIAIVIIAMIGLAQIVHANEVIVFMNPSPMLKTAVVFKQGGAQLQYDEFKKESKPFTFDQFSDQPVSITAGLSTSIQTMAMLAPVAGQAQTYPGVIRATINPRDIKYDSRIQINTGANGQLLSIELTGPKKRFSIFGK